MSTLTYTLKDSRTMLRRQLLHMRRYPSLTLMLAGMPVVFLLLFVYVFGGTMGDGIGGAGGGRSAYINYVAPGILIMAIAAAAQGTAIAIAMDMTEGIVARFRTMAISRAAVLTGHVLGSMIQVAVSLVIVTAVALAIGFRPNANAMEWLGAIGFIAAVAFALIWFAVALGMFSDTVETASNLPMPLMILPFIGSGFVPTESMPSWLQWFGDNQPFTPMIETIRGLLMGTPIDNSAVIALAWCAGIALVSYLWARSLFNKSPDRGAS